ncbi:MAG: hypothetical protein QGG09_06030, partial [Pirellulaceae bacterium]|nr:hypothetical protein [Pirellulaceae bacterium]
GTAEKERPGVMLPLTDGYSVLRRLVAALAVKEPTKLASPRAITATTIGKLLYYYSRTCLKSLDIARLVPEEIEYGMEAECERCKKVAC